MTRPTVPVHLFQWGEATLNIGEILWWLLLAGVLVWGWDYIQQFKR